MNPIRIGVVGCGILGVRHAQIYHQMPGVKLTAVMDTNPKRSQKLAEELGAVACASTEQMMDLIDAASICTPAVSHHEVAVPFLEAKKHLLIEKPITVDLADADDLIKRAKTNDLILHIGHIERYNGAVNAVKDIIEDPRFIECDRIGFFDPRIADVGVVLDLMIHDIDIVLYMVQSPIKSIDAVGMKVLSNSEDFANVRIHFENGAVCALTASRMAQKRRRKIRLFEKDRYISLDYFSQEALTFTRENAQLQETIYTPLDIRKSNPFQEELEEFIECVKGNGKPRVTGVEARAALDVALKILDQIQPTL